MKKIEKTTAIFSYETVKTLAWPQSRSEGSV